MNSKWVRQYVLLLFSFFPQEKRVEVGRLACRVAFAERETVVKHGQEVCRVIPRLALLAVGHCV